MWNRNRRSGKAAVLLAAAMTAVVPETYGLLRAQTPAPLSVPEGVFRTDVELVALNVTATNRYEQFVGGLEAKNFAVFEDGVAQELSLFSASRVPMDVALLLDTSSSMAPNMEMAQTAAVGLVETMQPGDRVSVTAIKRTAHVAYPLGGDLTRAVQAIRSTAAGGATSLYNALYLAMSEMVKHRTGHGELRKQAVVVLSDGEDTSSVVRDEDVLALAGESGIVLYAILLMPPFETTLNPVLERRAASQPQFVMRSFAEVTGGLSFTTKAAADLPRIYSKIASELAQQYTLGYVPKNARRDGTYRQVAVRVVDHTDVRARTRTGYYAPRRAAPGRALR